MKPVTLIPAALVCAGIASASPIGLMSAERETRWAGCTIPEDGPARQIAIWPSEPGFIVEYPESGCSGWHMPAPLESWVDANERLTTGPDDAAACEPSGDQVVYTMENNALRLQFFNEGTPVAEARLTPRLDQPGCTERTD
ncbi:MAG: hypothetical protein AAFW65_04855 [Pseudomonadota bacterium]